MTPTSLDKWRVAGNFYSHRGHRIFWRGERRAHGPLLLLIHGFPTASWDWEALWPELSRRYGLLAPDLIGFGFSDKPFTYDYSILDQADLCEGLLRAQGVAEYHVLAHDYGDTVAQELLARQGEDGKRPRLRSVCFLNGGLFPETHHPLMLQRLLLSPLGGLVARAITQPRFARTMTHVFGRETPPTPEQLEGFWQLLNINNGKRIIPKLIGYMVERQRHRERWVGALLTTYRPLKLINGAADPISGAHMADRYRELVPNPHVTSLPGIGHYPQLEAPREVLRAYLEFRDAL